MIHLVLILVLIKFEEKGFLFALYFLVVQVSVVVFLGFKLVIGFACSKSRV